MVILKTLAFFLLVLPALASVETAPDLRATTWKAFWIDVPGASPQAYGVYHFRRTFDLPSKPDHLSIHVSGDNRYQLYLNGTRVSWGPARGNLTHWRYETVDLARYLRTGKNVLAAVVWNDGEARAIAQVTNQTGFLLGADPPMNALLDTGRAWKCIEDKAYSPQPLPPDQKTGYYALAPNEKLDARLYPWGWKTPDYDDSAWLSAHEISHAAGRDARDAPNSWMLVESALPLEEQTREPDGLIRQVIGTVPVGKLPTPSSPLQIPPRTTASFLIDNRYLTTAYPEITVSGGQSAVVSLHYAETLYLHKSAKGVLADKGNRNHVEGKQFFGPSDTYLPDGGLHRTYRPLFWRTYRYLRLDIETAADPLTLEDLHGTFTTYPFQKTASLSAANKQENADIQQILDTGWRTARLCAHETYMDCPFYEQLQYAGDARIQMMISLYMTGDARLMRNGISLLNSSRTAEGATYSRAPSHLQQYIPPFSLWWIGMVHDYWMYVDDPAFARQMLPGVRAVLEFYAGYQKTNGSLNRMPWWNFVDWAKPWKDGVPPANPDGSSAAALDLQLLLAYQWASALEHALGIEAVAKIDEAAAEKLKATVTAQYWDAPRELFADQPAHGTYSQQANTLAVLAHVVDGDKARNVVDRLFRDVSLTQSSIYFRAYTNATLREVGLGNRYLDSLAPWREMLRDGLTTWAEWNGPDARSDCHAWGASPNFELLRTVAGIESAAPGFHRVRIAPNLGRLTHIKATMPHPDGKIEVDLRQTAKGLEADVELPPGITGVLDWSGHQQPLKSGKNHLDLSPIRSDGRPTLH